MKTISPVLTEQVVAAIQQALDGHLRHNGLAAFDAVNVVAQALNDKPWDEPKDKDLELDLQGFNRATRDVPPSE